jgi:hypothetical protein
MAALDALRDFSGVSTVSAVLVSSILIAYLAFMLVVVCTSSRNSLTQEPESLASPKTGGGCFRQVR